MPGRTRCDETARLILSQIRVMPAEAATQVSPGSHCPGDAGGAGCRRHRTGDIDRRPATCAATKIRIVRRRSQGLVVERSMTGQRAG